MNIVTIIKLFRENKLKEILDNCSETFSRITYYSDLLKNKVMDNKEIEEALQELTGLKMFLNPILAVAQSQKKENQGAFYQFKRKEIQETSGEKFVSAPVEVEASHSVSELRRLRNILEAYVNDCLTAINTCQSLLKYEGEYLKNLSRSKG